MKKLVSKFVYAILAKYAHKVIDKHHPFVVGIIGSGDRRLTVETVYQVFRDNFSGGVTRTYGKMGVGVGIPLTILGYSKMPNLFMWPFIIISAYFRTFKKQYPKYIVLEMGIEDGIDLEYYTKIVKPDIGIVLFLSLGSSDIINIVKENVPIFINVDDEAMADFKGERFITIGIGNKLASYAASGIKFSKGGSDYRIETVGQKISIKTSLSGELAIYSQLFAFAIGQYFNIQSLKIKSSLEKVHHLE